MANQAPVAFGFESYSSVVPHARRGHSLHGGGFFGNVFGKAKDAITGGLNTALNAYRSAKCGPNSRPLYKGEMHYGCHNFTGPGTRIDLPEVRNAQPVNDIDACSKAHDLAYEAAKGNAAAIQQADKKCLDCYARYKDEDGYLPATAGIGGKYALEKAASFINGKPTTFYGGKMGRRHNGPVTHRRRRRAISRIR